MTIFIMKQLAAKNTAPCNQINPNVFQPLNSNKYAEYSQIACTEHQSPQYENARFSLSAFKFFKQIGKMAKYQMKYCDVTTGLKDTTTNDWRNIQKPMVLRWSPKCRLIDSRIRSCGKNVSTFSMSTGFVFNKFI